MQSVIQFDNIVNDLMTVCAEGNYDIEEVQIDLKGITIAYVNNGVGRIKLVWDKDRKQWEV